MKSSTLFIFLILSYFSSLSCDFVCEVPSRLDTNTYIFEGRVTNITTNFTHPQILGEFGLVELVVTKSIYSASKIDTIYLTDFAFNGACEDVGNPDTILQKIYQVNQMFTIVGSKIDLNIDEKTCITPKSCCSPLTGSLNSRIKCDFENNRKLNHYLLKYVNKDMDISKSMSVDEANKFYDQYFDLEYQIMIPEIVQSYLTLVDIQNAKDENEVFSILKDFMWSYYIRDWFINEQNISDERKQYLISESKKIQSQYPY